MSVTFELEGQEFLALNGGPMFRFSPAISFFVKCATQQEVDHYWNCLSAGGTPQQCGWLQDSTGSRGRSCPTRSAKCCRTRTGKVEARDGGDDEDGES